MQKRNHKKEKDVNLGAVELPLSKFDNLSATFKEFKTKEFRSLNEQQKNERVNRILLDLIQKTPTPCFLLPAVLDYIDGVDALKMMESYSFLHFELYLNQFSGLTWEENLFVRGKIAGKWLPRDTFQLLFPIGMGKIYSGSHYVTAHSSPDLDTTVASFWGWIDAFTARVGQGLHVWNVPGGVATSQTEIQLLFKEIFGENVFRHLAKTRTTLALCGVDLMTQQGMMRKELYAPFHDIDYERGQNALVLVDEQGYYVGDWSSFDVEAVREVIALFNSCLRWFATHLHLKLVSLFSKERVSVKDLPTFIDSIFLMSIQESEPFREFSHKQKQYLDCYLKDVLDVKKGIESTFEELAKKLKTLSLYALQECFDMLNSLHELTIFDRSGLLVENRPRLFLMIEKIIAAMEKAIQDMRTYVDRLEIALKIKTYVFGYSPRSVSYRAEVEEIRNLMNDSAYLTVTATDEKGKLLPLGIVRANDLHKQTLGSVTTRDFCNKEEAKIPAYLEVISVIDHHKSHLQTNSAPTVLISDAQSSNVLCAELAFEINDAFSTGGMSVQQMQKQLELTSKQLALASNKRVLQRVLQRLIATECKEGFFIDPTREYIEYMHFLYAILDDTDLLTKVSIRDLECVAEILNRMKSLCLKKEVEILTLSDLARDEKFTARAAQRILQDPDMYSLYRKIYLAREESVDENIKLAAKNQPSSFFIDTKEQNGCVRVGQSKIFARNYPTFAKNSAALRKLWYEASHAFYQANPEVDLYIQMISTVASADDLYAGKQADYNHTDELWIWIAFSEQSIEHLKSYLNAFSSCLQVVHNTWSAEFYGVKAKEYDHIFSESFLSLAKKQIFAENKQLPLAILKYQAGTLNSRKAMITPYLPKL